MTNILVGDNLDTVLVRGKRNPGTFSVRCLYDKAILGTYGFHTGPIVNMAIRNDCRVAASVGEDGRMHVWDLNRSSKDPIKSFNAPSTKNVKFFRDHNEWIIADHRSTQLVLASTSSRTEDPFKSVIDANNLKHAFPEITCLEVGGHHTPNMQAAFGSKMGSVWLVDVWDRRLLMRYDAHHGAVTQIASSPEYGVLATAGADNVVNIFNTEGRVIRCNVKLKYRPTSLAFSKRGTFLAIGTEDGSAFVYEMEKFKLYKNTRYNEHPVEQVLFSQDDTSIYMATRDCKICLVDLYRMTYSNVWDFAMNEPALRIAKTFGHESLIECEDCGNTFWSNIVLPQEVSMFTCPDCKK